MPTVRWKKAWLLVAVMLLFFPSIFLLMEVPTKAKILKDWSTHLFWKIQDERPEYRVLGVWYLREQYEGLSDRELIRALETDFHEIDTRTIRMRYLARLENIRKDQILVILEALGVYSSVVILLYPVFGAISWLFGKLRFYSTLRSRRRVGSG